MNALSALLRVVCGLALVVAAGVTYPRTHAHVAEGQPIEIFGVTLGASPGQVQATLAVIALIGVLMVILGIVTLMKKRE